MTLVRRTLSVEILVECEEEAMPRTLNYVKTSVKGCCRNLHNGTVVLGLVDEDDRLVGLDITGNPSDAMQEMVEQLFEEETTQGETG